MRPQPLVAVSDVEASSRWYQRFLGCQSAHSGTEYERLVSNGVLILQLHRFEVEHHHGPIGNRDGNPLPMLAALCILNGWVTFDDASDQAIDLSGATVEGWESFRAFRDRAARKTESEA